MSSDFGFKISKSSTLNIDSCDTGLYEKLCEVIPDAKICIACGSCSSTCPASGFSGMSVRKVILGLQRGEDVRKMLTNCMLCGKSSMVCPRGINTRHLILTICRIYDR